MRKTVFQKLADVPLSVPDKYCFVQYHVVLPSAAVSDKLRICLDCLPRIVGKIHTFRPNGKVFLDRFCCSKPFFHNNWTNMAFSVHLYFLNIESLLESARKSGGLRFELRIERKDRAPGFLSTKRNENMKTSREQKLKRLSLCEVFVNFFISIFH